MKRVPLLALFLSAGLLSSPATAGYVVSATETSKLDADGVDFDYTITLTNAASSTSNVGTFWFAWVPGKDFLDVKPISEANPTGWTAAITHGSSTDGYAIQWIAGSGAALLPGNSLTFGFTSAESPAQVAGDSPFYPTIPEGTSFVYSGAPFSDAGDQFVVASPSAVPEPSSLALLGFAGLIGLGAARARRGRA